MANPVVRPCALCGAPVATQRLTSTPTCSQKCYRLLKQKQLEEQTTLTVHLGPFVMVTFTDVSSDTDREALRQTIIDGINPEVLAFAKVYDPSVHGAAQQLPVTR